MYLSDELRHGGGGRLPSRAQGLLERRDSGCVVYVAGIAVERWWCWWWCACEVVLVMSVLANGKGLRCRLCSRKTSEPAEERWRWRWRASSMGLAGWLAGSLACPHYKPSHHPIHKHGYHFR